MGKNKFSTILIVCFALLGPIMANVSAEVIDLPITGGVYHMISSPVLPKDPDPQMSLADDLGPYNKTQWRFFRYGYDPNLNLCKYFELKAPDWGSEQDFNFGRGYWIISKTTRTIYIEGEPVVGDRITLTHQGDGWNQVANIYDSDFLMEYLYVAPVSNPSDLKQLINALENDLTYVTLQEFENGSYADIPVNGSLEARKGYWLKVREVVGEDVYLIFDPLGLTSVSTINATNFMGQDFFIRVAQQEDPPDPPPSIEGSFSVSYGDGSSSGSGGCFIATAAYGDYYHPRVQILRAFRDQYLLPHRVGRILMEMYYRKSPILANSMVKCKPIKALTRFTLVPVIGISAIISKMNIYGLLMVLGFTLLGSFLFLRLRGGVLGICNLAFLGRDKEVKRKI